MPPREEGFRFSDFAGPITYTIPTAERPIRVTYENAGNTTTFGYGTQTTTLNTDDWADRAVAAVDWKSALDSVVDWTTISVDFGTPCRFTEDKMEAATEEQFDILLEAAC